MITTPKSPRGSNIEEIVAEVRFMMTPLKGLNLMEYWNTS
jgi:hypothetical protein